MSLSHVLVHHITPRKNTLGGAYFHTTNPIADLRWSVTAKVAVSGVNIGFGGHTPARIEIDLTDTETDALIEILKHARSLRAAAQPAANPDERLAA